MRSSFEPRMLDTRSLPEPFSKQQQPRRRHTGTCVRSRQWWLVLLGTVMAITAVVWVPSVLLTIVKPQTGISPPRTSRIMQTAVLPSSAGSLRPNFEVTTASSTVLAQIADLERRLAAANVATSNAETENGRLRLEVDALRSAATAAAAAAGATPCRTPAAPAAGTISAPAAAAADTRSGTALSLSAPLVAVAPSAAAAPPPLLVIGIPSVRRANDANYLNRTLRYILEQMAAPPGSSSDSGSGVRVGGAVTDGRAPGPHALSVRIVVMNNNRATGEGTEADIALVHPAFDAVRRSYCPPDACTSATVAGHTVWIPSGLGDNGAPPTVLFAQNRRPIEEDGVDAGSDNIPGYRVRRQTRDVADLMGTVAALFGDQPPQQQQQAQQQRYYMFAEDDFRLCPRGLEALAYLLAKAGAAYPDWNAVRVSFGLNGGIIRMADVGVLAAYFREHARRRPPDHLFVEFYAGETPASAAVKRGRPHVAFKYNLLEHFGSSSSLRSLVSPAYALCYDVLNSGVLFEVEAFSEAKCGATDLTPCTFLTEGSGGAELPRTDIDFGALAANARADTVDEGKRGP